MSIKCRYMFMILNIDDCIEYLEMLIDSLL